MQMRYQTDEQHRLKQLARVQCSKGRIESRPCEVCGSPNTEKHHEDYDKPFDVVWLCREHHLELHN